MTKPKNKPVYRDLDNVAFQEERSRPWWWIVFEDDVDASGRMRRWFVENASSIAPGQSWCALKDGKIAISDDTLFTKACEYAKEENFEFKIKLRGEFELAV